MCEITDTTGEILIDAITMLPASSYIWRHPYPHHVLATCIVVQVASHIFQDFNALHCQLSLLLQSSFHSVPAFLTFLLSFKFLEPSKLLVRCCVLPASKRGPIVILNYRV